MKSYIIIKTQFEAIHSWPECPWYDVNFLRNPHRHIFYVKVKISVSHNDRDVEFIQAKREINDLLTNNFDRKDLGRMSCEDICEKIKRDFLLGWPIHSISVFEDNENGAEIVFEGN